MFAISQARDKFETIRLRSPNQSMDVMINYLKNTLWKTMKRCRKICERRRNAFNKQNESRNFYMFLQLWQWASSVPEHVTSCSLRAEKRRIDIFNLGSLLRIADAKTTTSRQDLPFPKCSPETKCNEWQPTHLMDFLLSCGTTFCVSSNAFF